MSTFDLDAIKAREAKATPGPWTQTWNIKFGVKIWGDDVALFAVVSGTEHSRVTEVDPIPQWQKNVDFARCARQDIPALIAEVERLRFALSTRTTDAPVVDANGHHVGRCRCAECVAIDAADAPDREQS